MAYTATTKANLLQTAFNVAGTIVSAMVGAQFFENADDIRAALEEFKGDIYTALETQHTEDAANAPAPQPRQSGGRSYGNSGGGGGDRNNPATLVLNERYRKHAGKTLQAVFSEDPGYVQWLAGYGENGSPGCKNNWMNGKARAFLAQVGAGAPAADPNGYLPGNN